MKSRDEVLREFGLDPSWVGWSARGMADRIVQQEARIRELEAQQAASEPVPAFGPDGEPIQYRGPKIPASEPVAWAIVNRENVVSCAFVSEESARDHWLEGEERIVPLYAHPSALAVRVTDAMVEAYCEAKHGGWWDEMTQQQVDEERRTARGLLTAALTAASEGASA